MSWATSPSSCRMDSGESSAATHSQLSIHPSHMTLNSKCEAIQMQFITALAAFLGTAMGLLAMRHALLERWVLCLTTGGFLYVATVSVLPEVVRCESQGLQLCFEVLGLVVGVALMALVAIIE
jgi:zinc transporter 7